MYPDAFLNVRPNLFQDLGSQQSNRGRTVAHFGVLCSCDINERSRGRVDDVEKLKKGCAVIYVKNPSTTVIPLSENTKDSLEIVASPRSLTINLSIPLGPNVVAIVCATARHAEMLLSSWGVPWEESVPSRRRTTVGCCGPGRQ